MAFAPAMAAAMAAATPATTNRGSPMQPQHESAGDRAIRVFRQPPLRLNCAQAVAYAWASNEVAAEIERDDLMGHGGGGAPAGDCGALFAACQIAARRGGDPERVRTRFVDRHGSAACHELRANRVPCADCVRTAADLPGAQ